MYLADFNKSFEYTYDENLWMDTLLAYYARVNAAALSFGQRFYGRS
jgi:hypothetical protein